MFRGSFRQHTLRAAAVAVAALTARTVAVDVGSLHAQAHALGPLRGVVTARRTLLKGAIVGPGDIRIVARHTGQEPARVLTAAARAVGHVVTVDVAAGAPVLDANVAPGPSGTSGSLTTDERVVRIADAAGLTPEVGSIVDIYATFDPSSSAQTGTGGSGSNGPAVLVASGARVLRVDHQSNDLPATSGRAGSATTGMLVMVRSSETASLAAAVVSGVVTVAIAPVSEACCGSG